MRSSSLAFLLTLLFFNFSFLQAQQMVYVRVLLGEVPGDVSLNLSGFHTAYVDGALRSFPNLGMPWPLQANNGQLYVAGQFVGRSLTLEPHHGNLMTWDNTNYRGSLRFVANGNNFQVINVVDLESYLRGVVSAEMPGSWPLEALKAQAVAARTYVLYGMQPTETYDICATVECQKYSGVAKEHPSSDRAVLETAGQVLTYGGAFAKTYFHADSGGVLAAPVEVWGGSADYLVAHQDIAYDTPHRNWEKTLEAATIENMLASYGKSIGLVSSMIILSNTASSRVWEMEFRGSAGSVRLSGTTLTKMLRNMGLKSTRFSMIGDLSVVGNGFGHGVGMSQYGAKHLSGQGYAYSQILLFYYPGVNLQMMPYAVAQTQ
ncbi:MAG: SpoIID/LytB domain-containing protein [Trueperaceae bacterium]